MSEMAFWVLPWPSAYLKSVTLGHFGASSLPEAVVTSRQLLPPKPSSEGEADLLGAAPGRGALDVGDARRCRRLLPPPALPPLPQAETMSRTTAGRGQAGDGLCVSFIGTFLPVGATGLSCRRGGEVVTAPVRRGAGCAAQVRDAGTAAAFQLTV